jgi:hypothetical protein
MCSQGSLLAASYSHYTPVATSLENVTAQTSHGPAAHPTCWALRAVLEVAACVEPPWLATAEQAARAGQFQSAGRPYMHVWGGRIRH